MREAFDPRWLIAALAAMLVVLCLTHLPPAAMRYVEQYSLDKLEHITAYGTIAILFMLALRSRSDGRVARQDGGKPRKWELRGSLGLAVLIVVGLAAIAAADEWTQPYVNRTCDIWDWTADMIGTGGAFIIFLARRGRVFRGGKTE